MELVDEPRLQIRADRLNSAANADIPPVGGRLCLPQRRFDAVRDEMEGRPALHLERLPRVLSEDEDRGVVGRVLSPPASPALIRPRSPDRAKHLSRRARGKKPPMQGKAALSHGSFTALPRPRAVSIEGYRETAYRQFGHRVKSSFKRRRRRAFPGRYPRSAGARAAARTCAPRTTAERGIR